MVNGLGCGDSIWNAPVGKLGRCKRRVFRKGVFMFRRRRGMEIGRPRDAQHVNHVTFDRFDGFLGLPVEFQHQLPTTPPSASASVFGVSTESMQMSYDGRGNSVPTILLLMQSHLYSRDGLKMEGIFRVAAGNSQEETLRSQLNRGVIPQEVDVYCLAGLIKAWLRELPRGVLNSLSPSQVMRCKSEEDCLALVRALPQTESALLDWTINLMADVVQQESFNKMDSRNIATVFAPNMTKMNDPLMALMYTVQVMDFLKTLTEKTLHERKAAAGKKQVSNTPNGSPNDFINNKEIPNGNPSHSRWHKEARSEPTNKTLPKGSSNSIEDYTSCREVAMGDEYEDNPRMESSEEKESKSNGSWRSSSSIESCWRIVSSVRQRWSLTVHERSPVF